MVERSFRTLGDRLDFVIATCGYPDDATFMRSLQKDHQNLNNWRKRDSAGRSEVAIHELTGVSLNFLKTGKGEPFPDGVRRYQPPAQSQESAALRAEVHDLRRALLALIGHYAATTPGAGQEIVESVQDLLRGQAPGETLALLLQYLGEQAAESPQQRRALLRLVSDRASGHTGEPGL